MQYKLLKPGSKEWNQAGSCLVYPVFKSDLTQQDLDFKAELALPDGYWKIVSSDFEARLGEILCLYPSSTQQPERVLLVGCGSGPLTPEEFSEILHHSLSALDQLKATSAFFLLTQVQVPGKDLRWKIQKTILTHALVRDKSHLFKSEGETAAAALSEIFFCLQEGDPQLDSVITESMRIASGVALTIQLANLPANLCTPPYLVEQAARLSEETGGQLAIQIFDQAQLEAENFNGLLAVGKGSVYPPYLVQLSYKPENVHSVTPKPIVLIGKGVTFDSGGLCIKPEKSMEEMKYDMCGAATVLGTMKIVAELKLPIHVIGILAICENMPSHRSYRPGDILHMYSGATVEVLNTDAEGRLILADAISYASKNLDPDCIIDIATLTGACVIALGHHRAGLFTNDTPLQEALMASGEATRDLLWPMPIDKAYKKLIESKVADLCNCGGREASATTAALFLSHFTGGCSWAHLDIAGVSHRKGKGQKATGRPVPLLVDFLIRRAKKA